MARPGRPRLYHTLADQLLAKRAHSKKYYAKNRKRISERNKERYREQQNHAKQGELQTSPAPNVPQSTLAHPNSSSGSHTSTKRQPKSVQAIEAALMIIVKKSLVTFLDMALEDLTHSHSFSGTQQSLNHTLQQAEELHGHIHAIHAKVLQVHGFGVELQRVEVTSRRIRQAVHAVEDVLLNLDDSVEMQRSGQLAYQSLPDIVPIL